MKTQSSVGSIARQSASKADIGAESVNLSSDKVTLGFSSSGLESNLKFVGIIAGSGAIGYAGSAAHNIPYIGPVISGAVGAISGASVGALAGAKLGGKEKLGAIAGLVTGAIAGATCGGTLAGNIGMAVAGATVPVGLVMAILSGAS